MVTGLNIIGANKALQEHWIKRVVAYIVDVIIVLVISIVLVVVLFPFVWLTGGFGAFFFGLSTVILGLVAILYWIVQDGFMGGTIGKQVLGLRVVGTTGPVDVVKAAIRNVSKIHIVLLVVDWLVGVATEGDPRQKFTDRLAGTTVVRTDAHGYVEEQFRQMATPPPHPSAPTAGGPSPAPQAPPSGGAPPAGGQPAPAAAGGWPQHRWDEQGRLVQPPKFCANCGASLVPRGDGRFTCPRCGAVY